MLFDLYRNQFTKMAFVAFFVFCMGANYYADWLVSKQSSYFKIEKSEEKSEEDNTEESKFGKKKTLNAQYLSSFGYEYVTFSILYFSSVLTHFIFSFSGNLHLFILFSSLIFYE